VRRSHLLKDEEGHWEVFVLQIAAEAKYPFRYTLLTEME